MGCTLRQKVRRVVGLRNGVILCRAMHILLIPSTTFRWPSAVQVLLFSYSTSGTSLRVALQCRYIFVGGLIKTSDACITLMLCFRTVVVILPVAISRCPMTEHGHSSSFGHLLQ